MMAAEQNRILTVAEAAEVAGCSTTTIQHACRSGELRHGRLGKGPRGQLRISEAALREWIFGSQP